MSQFFLTILASIVTFLWTVNTLAATDRIYISPMEDSLWSISEDSVLRCEMEHSIPRFGKAVFYQESGRDLKLKVVSSHRYKKDLDIAFRSVSASWKGIETAASLARLKSSGLSTMVDVASDTARHAYFELQQGYQPSLFFIDDEDGYNSVSVILSTVRFREVQALFEGCVERLYPDHFDDVMAARVHFDFDDEFPSVEEEERALGRLLDYLKVDDSVQTITVTGHTDFKGTVCYNETLSARRAWYVHDFLVQSGIDNKRLRVRFEGESNPVAKGEDDQSRAKNRRVEVILQK